VKQKSDFSFVTSSLKMCDSSCVNMVRALLRPYEYRAWAQSNWVLVRIWQGCGFAFRYHKSPHLLRKLGPKLLQERFSLINQSLSMCFFLVVTCYERLKANSHIVCCAHVIPLPCCAAKGLECVFPISFTQCGHV